MNAFKDICPLSCIFENDRCNFLVALKGQDCFFLSIILTFRLKTSGFDGLGGFSIEPQDAS